MSETPHSGGIRNEPRMSSSAKIVCGNVMGAEKTIVDL